MGVGGGWAGEGFLFWPIHLISLSFCWGCPAPRCPCGLEAPAGVKGSLDPQRRIYMVVLVLICFCESPQ